MAITTFIEQFTRTPSRQNAATYSEDMDVRLSEENSRIIQMNEQAAQANTQAALLNSQIAQTTTNAATATEQAAIVTQKALEADTAKNEAVIKANEILEYVIPSGTAKSIDQSNTDRTAMSKAAFNAIASNNRDKFGGSGIVEPGKHTTTSGVNINDGLWTVPTYVNRFLLGRGISGNTGSSKTEFPYTNINGVVSKIYGVGNAAEAPYQNNIYLPNAPTVLPYTATLTAEQIASGVIKHADASNSGLIVNGKFDSGVSGWIVGYGGYTPLWDGVGKILLDSTTTVGVSQTIQTVIGKQYIVEFDIHYTGTIHNYALWVGTSVSSASTYNSGQLATPNGRVTHTFTAAATTSYINILGYVTTGNTTLVDNIAVFPADAISRQDFVYFKTNDVDLATVDFAYPLGLKQYLGADVDGLTGISVGAYSGALTASLFGTWQASGALVGKGYVWSTRTEAQKAAFRGNPENNTYSDGDKVRQVQGLMQVAMMKGDNFTEATAFASLGYTIDSVDKGLWRHADGSIAIGIALVHRRNQGGYNLTYNPHGTRAMTMTPTNIADCFTEANLTMTTGYIGTSTPIPGGLFYDQVSVEDFKPANQGADLRSSAQVKQYKSMFDSWVAKDTAGKLTFYPVTTAVSLTTLATDGTRTLAYSAATGRVYYTNATAQYQTDAFIKLGAIL